MAGKNFAPTEPSRVFDTIAAATSPAEEEQEIKPARKPRKVYSKEEAQAFLNEMHTSGRKGLKLPRINFALSPEIHQYVQVMSRVRGESMTDFINLALRQHMEENHELYEKAMEFRKALDDY